MSEKNEGQVKGKKQPKKNCHEGHRARLIQQALDVGVENLTIYQQVELFLFFILPRVDTNPISHNLLDEFENFARILDSSPNDLKRVYGVGQNAANMIHLFREIIFLYTASRIDDRCKITTLHELIDVVEDYVRFRNEEYMVLLAVSSSGYIASKRLVTCKNSNEVTIDLLEVTKFFTDCKPTGFVIAHCHPYGFCNPSKADVNSYNQIKDLCQKCGIAFLDSVIIGEDGAYSFNKEKVVRRYQDSDQIASVLNAAFAADAQLLDNDA